MIVVDVMGTLGLILIVVNGAGRVMLSPYNLLEYTEKVHDISFRYSVVNEVNPGIYLLPVDVYLYGGVIGICTMIRCHKWC